MDPFRIALFCIFYAMIRFRATMKKFDKKGEKTGWTYIEISADRAEQLKPGNKKEFKVKGKLDDYALKRISLLPMGGGQFILPVNASMRKALRKKEGSQVALQLELDESPFLFNPDFMECLKDDPAALSFFNQLPGSHQRYFSKWIDSAKTEPTKVKRIVIAINALSAKQGYGEMLRNARL